MNNETTKSYNPFKMWGSWAGLVLGIVGTFLYVGGLYPESLLEIRDLFLFVIVLNPLIWLAGWPILALVLTTPVFWFLYGWGVHSIFRKLDKRGRIMLSIALVILAIIGLTFAYTQSKQAFQAANPYYDYSVATLMANANDQSLGINTRLTMLEVMTGKIARMSSNEKKNLSDQLVSFNTSGLDSIDKERIAGRIANLQKLLVQ